MSRTAALLLTVMTVPLVASAPNDIGWPMHGGVDNIRYSPLDPDQSLERRGACRWRGPTTRSDAFKGSEMQSNPVVVDGVLYVTTPTMKVVALMRATRAGELDVRSERRERQAARASGIAASRCTRIASSSPTEISSGRSTAQTGKPIESFGSEAASICAKDSASRSIASRVSASTPGAVFEDLLIILGSSVPETLPGTPGHIRAFDMNTGKQRWIFHTIPQPANSATTRGPTTRTTMSGGANAWAGVTRRSRRTALVFAATGSASFDFYGVNRHGDNLFANCVLALDARTGRRVWHFQAIKHDVWDWDFPAAPNLVTVTRNGRRVEAVAQITKTGYVFVFDRRTGTPLFPIEYRKVRRPTSTANKPPRRSHSRSSRRRLRGSG